MRKFRKIPRESNTKTALTQHLDCVETRDVYNTLMTRGEYTTYNKALSFKIEKHFEYYTLEVNMREIWWTTIDSINKEYLCAYAEGILSLYETVRDSIHEVSEFFY